ncbi:mechanosensitive ion channel family [Plectosphaerella cucumerina]|uniref:Mechanosensitive ion channel protein n=1 Tax=Plectosphaerella cucumerina TaxID=40658 RepID=A0A8K0TNJ3_9PEZI|nr:mechanosensitive ion channel family [Plectosphaerella cucumerina]
MTTPVGSRSRDEFELDERRSSHTADTLNDLHNHHGSSSYAHHQQSQEKAPRLNSLQTQHNNLPPENDLLSPGGTREQASRLNDDLELLRAERIVSNAEHDLARSRSKSRQHHPEPEDLFAGNPGLEDKPAPSKDYKAAHKTFIVLRWLKKIPRCFRYLLYLIPGAGLLLIPIFMGLYNDDPPIIGGSSGLPLLWFGIWLMILYCTLWGSRMVTSMMPHIFNFVATLLGSTNHKKWKDVGRSLEIHTSLFIWMLINLITFQILVDKHRAGYEFVQWIDIVNKIIIALFVLAILNWLEKICIQWIATSFHMRTYSQRIETNKSDIHHLIRLYIHAKEHVAGDDDTWKATGEAMAPGGTRTPMAALHNNVRHVFNKAGDVANRVGNDFIGRKSTTNTDKKVVYELLRTTASAHTLARLIYRSLVSPSNETIYMEDMQVAFTDPEEAEVAFGIFDKDFNGDISMEEMEAVCNEIHLERKAIAASLKDLDSVIKKLDKVFFTVIFVVAIIIFITILSASAAAGLASTGTAVLGLAWMLQATAQEFLQSIIFVFVKHPFDVGDRVTIYGSTGSNMTGDDYYVTEISLLYTEFKKMEGHIVQAPNSVLNTLFILNQRRSSGLADVVPLELGITNDPSLIEELKARMVDFALQHKRDYQPRVLTEVQVVNNVQSFSMNFIFFHKSNFQNELLRLTRHNKFVAQLMAEIKNLGFSGPWQVAPGASRDTPMYWCGPGGPPAYENNADDRDGGDRPPNPPQPSGAALQQTRSNASGTSVSRSAIRQIPTIEENFADFQDVFESRKREHNPQITRLQSIREQSRVDRERRSGSQERGESPHASASGAALRQSIDSHHSRRHIFGGRSRSKSQTKPQEMV